MNVLVFGPSYMLNNYHGAMVDGVSDGTQLRSTPTHDTVAEKGEVHGD